METYDALTAAFFQSTKFESHPKLGQITLQVAQLRFSRHDFRIELAYRVPQAVEQSGLRCPVLVSCIYFGELPLSGISFGCHALAAVSQQIEGFFLRPNCLHIFTNGLLVLSELAESRRKFEKEVGRGTERILNDASETKVVASLEVILSPTDHHLRPGPNYAEPPMPARSVN
jgi:hypothetical protein